MEAVSFLLEWLIIKIVASAVNDDTFFNDLTRNASVEATSTCGLVNPERFCYLAGSGLYKGLSCDLCDSLLDARKHPPHAALMGDGNQWWQSVTGNENVNFTLDLGQVVHVGSLVLRAGPSPRPKQWTLLRSVDGMKFLKWQWFADGKSSCQQLVSTNSASCSSFDCSHMKCDFQQAAVLPFVNGEIFIDLISGRHNNNLAENEPLQKWTRARYVRFQLQRLHSLEGTYFPDDHNPGSFQQHLFYSLSSVEVFGLCPCNTQWSKKCYSSTRSLELSIKSQCHCFGNSCGPRCTYCCPGFYKVPDAHAQFQCRECNCNEHSKTCVYDPANGTQLEYFCLNCQNNTTGRTCHKCLAGFRIVKSFESQNETFTCEVCNCSINGSIHTKCNNNDGHCVCRPGFAGYLCDRCAANYWGFPKCQECQCYGINMEPNTCDETTGKCLCHDLMVGKNCDTCIHPMHLIGGKCYMCTSCEETLIEMLNSFLKELSCVKLPTMISVVKIVNESNSWLLLNQKVKLIKLKINEKVNVLKKQLAGSFLETIVGNKQLLSKKNISTATFAEIRSMWRTIVKRNFSLSTSNAAFEILLAKHLLQTTSLLCPACLHENRLWRVKRKLMEVEHHFKYSIRMSWYVQLFVHDMKKFSNLTKSRLAFLNEHWIDEAKPINTYNISSSLILSKNAVKILQLSLLKLSERLGHLQKHLKSGSTLHLYLMPKQRNLLYEIVCKLQDFRKIRLNSSKTNSAKEELLKILMNVESDTPENSAAIVTVFPHEKNITVSSLSNNVILNTEYLQLFTSRGNKIEHKEYEPTSIDLAHGNAQKYDRNTAKKVFLWDFQKDLSKQRNIVACFENLVLSNHTATLPIIFQNAQTQYNRISQIILYFFCHLEEAGTKLHSLTHEINNAGKKLRALQMLIKQFEQNIDKSQNLSKLVEQQKQEKSTSLKNKVLQQMTQLRIKIQKFRKVSKMIETHYLS